jgi:cell division protease FtsH
VDKKKLPMAKRPVIVYYAIAMVVILLLNTFLFPNIMEKQVSEVTYDKFLTMLDSGTVREVAQDTENKMLVFTAADASGTVAYYKTGLWPDDSLTERLQKAGGVVFSTNIPTQASPLISFLMTWILPVAFFLLIGQLMTRFMQKRIGGGSMSFGKANAKIYAEKETGVTFADVAGEEEAKEALVEIVDYLHGPEKYKTIGAKLPKGALLVGPPGTGKTLLARAVAGEAKVPFFSISGSEFVEMFVGMGAAKVRDLFKQAAEKAPCIVFIDEIDAVGKRRDTGFPGGNDEREQTLNQLLTEMDGFESNKGVVILGATNRPETLDKALLRPGRFDRRIPVNLPDLAGREAILRVHAAHVKTVDAVDYKAVARATSGASGADLANIINEAALRAVRQGRDAVTQGDLEESVEVVIAGYQKKSHVMSEKEKQVVALHEVGHALVAALQSNSAPVHKITIIPRTSGALGYTMQVDEEEHFLMSKEEMENKIATLTGGRAAEELAAGTTTTGASNDIEQATALARAMVTRFGMSEEFGMVALETQNNPFLGGDSSLACSSDTAAMVDRKVVEIVKAQHEKARKLITNNMELLKRIANRLFEQETITGEQFMQMLKENAA